MNPKVMIPSILLAAGLATAGGLAFAKPEAGARNDAVTDLAQARVGLAQAVGSAETHAGGKATKAELEGEHGAVVYQVEVVTPDSKVFDVKVDAADGRVLTSRADAADRSEHEDHED
jgi:uncharacterized membrane protein YkoI